MNIISINHIYKLFFIFLAVLIIGIPINSLPYFFLFLISFAIIILSKLKKFNLTNNTSIHIYNNRKIIDSKY